MRRRRRRGNLAIRQPTELQTSGAERSGLWTLWVLDTFVIRAPFGALIRDGDGDGDGKMLRFARRKISSSTCTLLSDAGLAAIGSAGPL